MRPFEWIHMFYFEIIVRRCPRPLRNNLRKSIAFFFGTNAFWKRSKFDQNNFSRLATICAPVMRTIGRAKLGTSVVG